MFDLFEDAVAHSAKTMDMQTAAKLMNPDSIYGALKRYVDNVAEFTESHFKDIDIYCDLLNQRTLDLAVPSATTVTQLDAIMRAAQYAKDNGVVFNLYFIQ